MIEPYRAPAHPAWIGNVAFVAALLVHVSLLHLSHVLKLHEREAWWASNGRDAVNALALLTLFGAISLQGVALPLALLLAATITLILTVLHDALAPRMEHPAAAVLVAAALAAAPLLLAPGAVAGAAAGALAWAFGSF